MVLFHSPDSQVRPSLAKGSTETCQSLLISGATLYEANYLPSHEGLRSEMMKTTDSSIYKNM